MEILLFLSLVYLYIKLRSLTLFSKFRKFVNWKFHIDWQDQDNRENFKNLQERNNNYRNYIVLSCSRAALIRLKYYDTSSYGIPYQTLITCLQKTI